MFDDIVINFMFFSFANDMVIFGNSATDHQKRFEGGKRGKEVLVQTKQGISITVTFKVVDQLNYIGLK